jgi:hypothetical protein
MIAGSNDTRPAAGHTMPEEIVDKGAALQNPFPALPVELIDSILKKLEPETLVVARMTCRWLRDAIPADPTAARNVSPFAAKNGYLKLLQWLYQNGAPRCPYEVGIEAAKGVHLETLDWVIKLMQASSGFARNETISKEQADYRRKKKILQLVNLYVPLDLDSHKITTWLEKSMQEKNAPVD